jgi:hypothetical protein
MSFHNTEEFEAGRQARELLGLSILDNPHPPSPKASSPYRQWTRGWMAADREAEEAEEND